MDEGRGKEREAGGRGGGREEEAEEEPSMRDQTSASHWFASLAFSDRRLRPKTMGEGERGGGGRWWVGIIENSQMRADAMIAASGL